jgi:hypothetical protein
MLPASLRWSLNVYETGRQRSRKCYLHARRREITRISKDWKILSLQSGLHIFPTWIVFTFIFRTLPAFANEYNEDSNNINLDFMSFVLIIHELLHTYFLIHKTEEPRSHCTSMFVVSNLRSFSQQGDATAVRSRTQFLCSRQRSWSRWWDKLHHELKVWPARDREVFVLKNINVRFNASLCISALLLYLSRLVVFR